MNSIARRVDSSRAKYRHFENCNRFPRTITANPLCGWSMKGKLTMEKCEHCGKKRYVR